MSGDNSPFVESTEESIDDLFDIENSDDESADPSTPEPPPTNENWLSTGIEALDRALNGGVPPGRLVSFAVSADTQGELFVKQIAAQHDSLYLSTLRPEWEVEETVRDHLQQVDPEGAGRIETRVHSLDSDGRLQAAREYLEYIDDRSVVVIDSVDELETADESEYVEFIHELKRRLWETRSVGLLVCFEGEAEPSARRITFRLSDIVWQLRRSVQTGSIEYLLVVSKYRGGRALDEPVKLELTDEIEIDTSRDIA